MQEQVKSPSPLFVFVGENRSKRAQAMEVTWRDGRLAARTLFEALRVAGIDPEDHTYVNLFEDGPGFRVDWAMRDALRRWQEGGRVIVAMGRRVQAELTRCDIPFTPLVHPAARGQIRARTVYQAHVATALGGAVS